MAAPDLPCSDRGFQTAKGTKKFQRWHPPAPIYRLQKDRSRHIPSVKPQCENGWTWKILLTFPILPMPTCPLSDDVAQQEAVRFTLTRLSSHKKLPTLPGIHPSGPFQHHPFNLILSACSSQPLRWSAAKSRLPNPLHHLGRDGVGRRNQKRGQPDPKEPTHRLGLSCVA